MVKTNNRAKGKTVRQQIDFLHKADNADFLLSDNFFVGGNVLRAQRGWTLFNDKAHYTRFYGSYTTGIVASIGTNLVYIDVFGKILVYNFSQPAEPFASVTHRDKIFGTIKSLSTLLMYNGNSYPFWSVKATSYAVLGERLFGINEATLYFSEISENFSDHTLNNIKLPSRCTALAAIDNCLYVLGSKCYKLIPSADSAEMKYTQIYDGLQDVLADTVTVIGNKIVFATENGMYCMTDGKVKRIFKNLVNIVDLKTMYCRGLDNYCVAYCYPKGGGAKKAVMLDIENESVAGVLSDVYDITYFRGKMLAVCSDGTIKSLAETYAENVKFVKSGIDFNILGKKHLRKLVVKTATPIDVYITADNVTRLYKVNGKKGVQTLPVAGTGERFNVTVRAKGETKTDLLELVAETYGEG